MWVLADVVGLFSTNVGSFSRNVGRSGLMFSANVVPNPRMLSGPASYVLGPLQLLKSRQGLPKSCCGDKQSLSLSQPTTEILHNIYYAQYGIERPGVTGWRPIRGKMRKQIDLSR
jgi:hypothetical protein